MPDFHLIENKILNILAEKRESLKLIWVPAYMGKEENEAADKSAKYPLNENFLPETKATEECSKENFRK
jgi:ribonuclease HI